MNIVTRDLLAALLVDTLDDRVAADALRCLARYCCEGKEVPLAMPIGQFLLTVSVAEREQVTERLRQSELLSWHGYGGSEAVSLTSILIGEYSEITAKLKQYIAVLQEWIPDETAPALITALRKGVLLFNHSLFFEVHEVLEAQWLKESSDVRPFLQGLIQVAVAFYHLGNQNFRGTISLLQDGLAKLRPHQPTFLGVQLYDFIPALEACSKELLRLGPEGLSHFQLQMIPQIRFIP